MKDKIQNETLGDERNSDDFDSDNNSTGTGFDSTSRGDSDDAEGEVPQELYLNAPGSQRPVAVTKSNKRKHHGEPGKLDGQRQSDDSDSDDSNAAKRKRKSNKAALDFGGELSNNEDLDSVTSGMSKDAGGGSNRQLHRKRH